MLFTGLVKGGFQFRLPKIMQKSECMVGGLGNAVDRLQPIASVERGIMESPFLIDVARSPVHAAGAQSAQFTHRLADERRVVALIMIEGIRPGGRVPLPSEKREIRSPGRIQHLPHSSIQLPHHRCLFQTDGTFRAVEKRQIAGIRMSRNEITPDPVIRIIRRRL